MGIRFRCHHCEEELNVKDHLAGKKGRCPKCQERFRVPLDSAEYSLEVQEKANANATHGPASPEQTREGPPEQPTTEPAQSTEVDQLGEPPLAAVGSEAPTGTDEAVEFNVNSQASVWYVRPPSGGEYGPATASVFQGWIQEHRVTADSFIWKDGWPDWQLASTVLPNHFPSHGTQPVTPPSQVQPQLRDIAASQGELPLADSSTTKESGTVPGSEQLSLSEKNRLTRKQKRKRNYTISIVVLSVLAIVLLVALVVALLVQQKA